MTEQSGQHGANDAATQTLAVRYALARGAKRHADRTRIHGQIVHPIDTPRLLRDPLSHPRSRLAATATVARLINLAIFIHAGVLLIFFVLGGLMGGHNTAPPPERVVIRIVDPPPIEEPPPVDEPEVVEAPPPPDFAQPEPKAEPEPKPDKPPPPPPKRKLVEVAEPPPSELPATPEPTPQPQRRRIVGLSLESTVSGGSGPSFATGTSRMGRTERRAEDPKVAAKPPAGPQQRTATAPQPVYQQRAAARIPTRDAVFVKPKRAKPSKPPYPEQLKAQGIEGQVLVRVDIAPAGHVTNVTILSGSGHAAFDEAARKAALSETFVPATRDGKPVAFTLSYHYRFRMED